MKDRDTQGEAQGQPHCCSKTPVEECIRGCAGPDGCRGTCNLAGLISSPCFQDSVVCGTILCYAQSCHMKQTLRYEYLTVYFIQVPRQNRTAKFPAYYGGRRLTVGHNQKSMIFFPPFFFYHISTLPHLPLTMLKAAIHLSLLISIKIRSSI